MQVPLLSMSQAVPSSCGPPQRKGNAASLSFKYHMNCTEHTKFQNTYLSKNQKWPSAAEITVSSCCDRKREQTSERRLPHKNITLHASESGLGTHSFLHTLQFVSVFEVRYIKISNPLPEFITCFTETLFCPTFAVSLLFFWPPWHSNINRNMGLC